MSGTLIWHTLKKDAVIPVCDKEEVTKLEEGSPNTKITLVKVYSNLDEFISKIFHFEEPSSLKSLNISQLVITKDKKSDINSLIESESLSAISESIFMVIAAINSRIADIKEYQLATKKYFGLDVRNYADDEEELECIVNRYHNWHYAKTYIDNIPDEEREYLKSITFTFGNKKTNKKIESFKIENFFLILTIMERIMKGGGIDPIVSANWDTIETNLKQLTARALLHYLMEPNTSLSSIVRSKAHAHRIIAEIFNLTDSSDVYVDEALVKKWVERAGEKE